MDELNHSIYSLASNCRRVDIVGGGGVAEFARNWQRRGLEWMGVGNFPKVKCVEARIGGKD